jgi:hypothetical protein
MLIEFTHRGKAYQFTHASTIDQPPPLTLTIPFKPCVLRPPVALKLEWLGTDTVRMVELYRPVGAEAQP